MLWFWILGWLLSLSTVLGNGLVMFLIATRHQLRTTANWFVLSLGVADFCVGFWLFPPLFACQAWGLCNETLATPLRWYFLHSSVVNLCAMVLDRHIAITRPLRYVPVMTPVCVFLLIALSWGIVTVAFLIPFTILFSRGDSDRLEGFFVFVLIFLKILPMIWLMVATAHILWITRKISRSIAAQVSVHFNNSRLQVNLQRVRKHPTGNSAAVIVSLVCLFFLCYTIDIYFLLCDSFYLCTFAPDLSLFKRLLLLTNSALNPLTYAFLKRDIKREIRRMFNVISGRDSTYLQ